MYINKIRYLGISNKYVIRLQYWYVILLKSFEAGLPIFCSKIRKYIFNSVATIRCSLFYIKWVNVTRWKTNKRALFKKSIKDVVVSIANGIVFILKRERISWFRMLSLGNWLQRVFLAGCEWCSETWTKDLRTDPLRGEFPEMSWISTHVSWSDSLPKCARHDHPSYPHAHVHD